PSPNGANGAPVMPPVQLPPAQLPIQEAVPQGPPQTLVSQAQTQPAVPVPLPVQPKPIVVIPTPIGDPSQKGNADAQQGAPSQPQPPMPPLPAAPVGEGNSLVTPG